MKFEDFDIETIIASLCAQLRRAETNAGFLERQNAQRLSDSLPKPKIKPVTGKQLKKEADSLRHVFGLKRDPKTGQFLGKKKI